MCTPCWGVSSDCEVYLCAVIMMLPRSISSIE
jgi:hypothetical protein